MAGMAVEKWRGPCPVGPPYTLTARGKVRTQEEWRTPAIAATAGFDGEADSSSYCY